MKKKKDSISVVITAYNEEKNLLNAVASVRKALAGSHDHEIIIVDDGSGDGTGKIIRNLVKKDSRILAIFHKTNMGIGRTLNDGIKRSSKKYLTVFPGDNDVSYRSLRELIESKGTADIVFSYPGGLQHRSLVRKILSVLFVRILNLVFRLRLRYYNGPFITELSKIKTLNLKAKGFLSYAEVKIRMIKKGYSYHGQSFIHTGRKYGSSSVLSAKNILDTIRTIVMIYTDLRGKQDLR